MKRELALRIIRLNELITDAEHELSVLKDSLKDLKERRDSFIRELVMLEAEER